MQAPPISVPLLRFFRRIVRRYFRRHFTAVRVSGAENIPVQEGHADPLRVQSGPSRPLPLLIYANHGSWWDPMVSILLAETFLPGRSHYAPMDAAALDRYAILKRLGIFPVDGTSGRGAVQFLRAGEGILAGGGVLWVTPQGRFVDARVRPLEFKPGLAALAARVAPCQVLPLAIEYTFWDERLPECLLHFGAPVEIPCGESAAAVEVRLEKALVEAMTELVHKAVQRDSRLFTTLLEGRTGTGGFYEIGQRLKALVGRREYLRRHTPEADSTP